MHKYLLLLIIFVYSGSSCNSAPGTNTSVDAPPDSVRIIKGGLDHPWEIRWGKDDHIWMTERGGKISKLDPKTGATVFSASIAEVVSRGEGGLLGMVQHPDFLHNGLFYVVYNYKDNAIFF